MYLHIQSVISISVDFPNNEVLSSMTRLSLRMEDNHRGKKCSPLSLTSESEFGREREGKWLEIQFSVKNDIF